MTWLETVISHRGEPSLIEHPVPGEDQPTWWHWGLSHVGILPADPGWELIVAVDSEPKRYQQHWLPTKPDDVYMLTACWLAGLIPNLSGSAVPACTGCEAEVRAQTQDGAT